MKPINKYFPDIPTAIKMIEAGKKKYGHHKIFVLDNDHVRGEMSGKYYIDNALAAIMYATGKEPATHDLNTPSETYGWSFDETRNILNALSALSNNNNYYWHLYYGQSKVESPLKLVYKNHREINPAPLKTFAELLAEKWLKKDRIKAAKKYKTT